MDTQYLRDIARLADRVQQVEWLKAEKVIVNRNKKEIVAYVGVDDNDHGSDVKYNHVEEKEVDLSELKSGNFLHHRMGRTLLSLKRVTNSPRKSILLI